MTWSDRLTVKKAIGVGCGGGAAVDIREVDDALGGELTTEAIGTGVCGDKGIFIWLGGDAANGVYNSTAAPDSFGEDLKQVSNKRLLIVVGTGCSLNNKNNFDQYLNESKNEYLRFWWWCSISCS